MCDCKITKVSLSAKERELEKYTDNRHNNDQLDQGKALFPSDAFHDTHPFLYEIFHDRLTIITACIYCSAKCMICQY